LIASVMCTTDPISNGSVYSDTVGSDSVYTQASVMGRGISYWCVEI